MNISGRPVANALRSISSPPSSLIVIHDSLAHKQNVISPKFGGSANGHNGVRSIITALGDNPNFHRLRVGIGKNTVDAAAYVLGRLAEQEVNYWGENGQGTAVAWKAIEKIVKDALKPAQVT